MLHQSKLVSVRRGRLYLRLLQSREGGLVSVPLVQSCGHGGGKALEDLRVQGTRGSASHRAVLSESVTLVSLLFSLMITFREMTPRSLRKTFLGYKTGKRLFKRFTYHRAEKEFTVMSRLKEML